MAYEFELSDDEKRELLRIARTTLKEYLASGRIHPGAPHRPSLVAPAGVFVTLHRSGALRGCIGTTAETSPLFRAVQDMAVAAAQRDPRFEPVTRKELGLLEIEVSVLGAWRTISSPQEIEVGRHGLMVQARNCRGLLLPRVAVDQGWAAVTFLEMTCEKAGLEKDAWTKPGTKVEAFTTQVFAEKETKQEARKEANPPT